MTAQKPLPERMRPDDPDLFLGQSHLALVVEMTKPISSKSGY